MATPLKMKAKVCAMKAAGESANEKAEPRSAPGVGSGLRSGLGKRLCNPIRVVFFRGVLPVWLDRGRELVRVRIRASTEEALAKMDRVGVRNRVRIRVRVRVRERTEEALAEVVDDCEAGGDADDVLDARAPPLGVDLAPDQLVGRAWLRLALGLGLGLGLGLVFGWLAAP